ncbi:hypothetical protein BDZ85DRAFT_45608 [Elsinoe ampelina]|uniref:Chromo domain-containing protein n=1 Tax=Elsinoe ampelina TaxID=302913 RepID=A0A6A6G1E5_9PEZI|nr:hypothetical protein BDZ85DRAFT_45608 [Elsinoe ampelina]
MSSSDSDEDDCASIGSQDTVFEREYEIEDILAARRFGDKVLYLAKWVGYDLDQCTWEPRHSFGDEPVPLLWRERQVKLKKGELKDVDVKDINAQIRRAEQERQNRLDRRERLRQRRERLRQAQARAEEARNARERASPARPKRTRGVAVKRTSRNGVTIQNDSEGELGSPVKKRKLVRGRKQLAAQTDSEDELSAIASTNSQPEVDTEGENRDGIKAARRLSEDAIDMVTKSSKSISQSEDTAVDSRQILSASEEPTPHDQLISDLSKASRKDSNMIQASGITRPTEIGVSNPATGLSVPDLDMDDAMSDGSLFGGSSQNDRPDQPDGEEPSKTPARIHTAIPRSIGPIATDSPSGASASTATPTKTFVRTRTSGISMTSRPVERRKSNKIGEDGDPGVAANAWSLRRQNIHRKYMQNHERPDADSLDIIDPKTGEVVRAAQRAADFSPNDLGQTSYSPNDYSVSDDERRANLWGDEPGTRTASIIRAKRPATCRRWLKQGACKFGEECHYLHELTDKWEAKTHSTCALWVNGRCKFGDELCDRYHCRPNERNIYPPSASPARGTYSAALRGQLSAAAFSALQRWERQNGGQASVSTPDNLSPSSGIARSSMTYAQKMATYVERYGPPPREKKDITCRFWLRDRCTPRPGRSCEYAHACRTFVGFKMSDPCKHWAERGSCIFSEALCLYHHCPFSGGDAAFLKYPMTCPAWKSGHCEYSAEDCDLYHVLWDPSVPEGERHPVASPESIVNDASDGELFEPATIATKLRFPVSNSPDSLAVNIAFADSTVLIATSLAYRAGELAFENLCFAADLAWRFQDAHKPTHEGFIDAADDLTKDQLQNLSSHLLENLVGAIAYVGEVMVVVHAPDDETWHSLHAACSGSSIAAPLSLIAFDMTTLPGPFQVPFNTVAGRASVPDIAPIDLNPELLFCSVGGRKLRKLVYLMFPLDLEHEMNALKTLLEEQEAQVMTTLEPGSWRVFIDKALSEKQEFIGGTVIWYPTITNYWQIPFMNIALHRASINHLRFETKVAITSTLAAVDSQRMTLTRIFTRGYAALIVDEVFIEEPHRALTIVQKFAAELEKSKTNSVPPNCLVVRPGIMEMLTELMERAKSDDLKTKYYTQIGKLMLPLVYPYLLNMNESGMNGAEYQPSLKLPTITELPEYHVLASQNQAKATSALVAYFCQFALSKVDQLSKFSVILPKYAGKDDVSASDDDTERRHDPILAPRTPKANELQREKADTDKRPPGDKTRRARQWQEQYRHVLFETSEKFLMR